MYRKHAIYSNEIHYKTVNMLYNILHITTTWVNYDDLCFKVQ